MGRRVSRGRDWGPTWMRAHDLESGSCNIWRFCPGPCRYGEVGRCKYQEPAGIRSFTRHHQDACSDHSAHATITRSLTVNWINLWINHCWNNSATAGSTQDQPTSAALHRPRSTTAQFSRLVQSVSELQKSTPQLRWHIFCCPYSTLPSLCLPIGTHSLASTPINVSSGARLHFRPTTDCTTPATPHYQYICDDYQRLIAS